MPVEQPVVDPPAEIATALTATVEVAKAPTFGAEPVDSPVEPATPKPTPKPRVKAKV